MKDYAIIPASVVDVFDRIEMAITRSIENYLHLSARVYLTDNEPEFTAAWYAMSRDNSYVKEYVSKLTNKVYRFDAIFNEETGRYDAEGFIEDPLTFHRLLKLERELENLFDAREQLFYKYGVEEMWQASDKKKSA